jgi:hypothetical protein
MVINNLTKVHCYKCKKRGDSIARGNIVEIDSPEKVQEYGGKIGDICCNKHRISLSVKKRAQQDESAGEHNGRLAEQILINVFKSLVLSHLHYSSAILVACSDRANMAMQVQQNTLLRSIGIHTTDLASKAKYGIVDVSEFIMSTCLSQVSRILDTPGHALRERLLLPSTSRRHSACPFLVPRAGTKFMKNAVITTLVHLRDVVYGTGRSTCPAPPPSVRPQPPPQSPPARGRPGGVICTNPACPNPTKAGELYLNLGVHLKSCLSKYPPPQ